MLAITDTQGNTSIVKGQEVQITETLGNLSTLSFVYYNDHNDINEGKVMAPFSTVNVPELNEDYLIQNYQTDPIGDYIQYTVTAIQVGTKFHWHYVQDKIGQNITTSKDSEGNVTTTTTPVAITFQQAMDHIFSGSGFDGNADLSINRADKRTFQEGFGGDYADNLLQSMASAFGFEYSWHNEVCTMRKKLGDKDKFLFIDNVNCNKISAQEDDSVITTKATGSYTGTASDGKTPVSLTSSYTSPLVAEKGFPIIEAQPLIDSANDNSAVMTQGQLDGQVKALVHDYPNIQYTVDGANFKKYSQLNGDVQIGDYGYLRTRQGIDVETRVQSKTWYPQEVSKIDAITFGNLALNPVTYLAHQATQLEKYESWYSDMSNKITDVAKGYENINQNFNDLENKINSYQTQTNQDISNLQNQVTQSTNTNNIQVTLPND